MGREHFIGQRALHSDFDLTGVILDVHMDIRPQTAKFLPDGWDEHKATWVNLDKLKLLPPGKSEDDEEIEL
jgi:hypothetical protein